MLTSHDVEAAVIRTVRLQPGYNLKEVDDFLDTAAAALQAVEQGAPAPPTPRPDQVISKTFTVTWLREGYDRRQVKILLARVAAALAMSESHPPRETNWVAAPNASAPPAVPTSGLSARELANQILQLQAVQVGPAQTAPVQVRTPAGTTFTVAAVGTSPAGLVVQLNGPG